MKELKDRLRFRNFHFFQISLVAMAAADARFRNIQKILVAKSFDLDLFRQAEQCFRDASVQSQMLTLIRQQNVRHRTALAQCRKPVVRFRIVVNQTTFLRCASARIIAVKIFTFFAVRSFHSQLFTFFSHCPNRQFLHTPPLATTPALNTQRRRP